MHKFHAIVTFMVALLVNSPVVAEINFNGFGSLYAGKVGEGSEFLADFPKAGVYDNHWSLSPDSKLGLQFSSYYTNGLSLISQITVSGITNLEADVDWLYLNYHLNSELSIQFGRKRLPLFYYSDFLDLGYAYYWIRPPADLYTWQITNYNGISLLYERTLSDWDTSINLYYGNEESDDNDLLGLLFGVPINENWKDMVGIVGTMANDWVDIRLSFMQSLVDRELAVSGVSLISNTRQQFLGLSANITSGQFQALSEFNKYVRPDDNVSIDTYMLSFGYSIGDFTPHVTRSALEQKINVAGDDEKHHTTTLGVRWDFRTDIAFKIQYDHVVDEGVVVPIKGDSKTITLGLDFVF